MNLPPVTASPAALAAVVVDALRTTNEAIELAARDHPTPLVLGLAHRRNARLIAQLEAEVVARKAYAEVDEHRAYMERQRRIDAGEECPTCGTRERCRIAPSTQAGVDVFLCDCGASWVDCNDRDPEPHLEPEWFDAKAGV